MTQRKNYQIRVSEKGSQTVIKVVYGKLAITALAAAKRMYPNHDYYQWALMENGEYAYMCKMK